MATPHRTRVLGAKALITAVFAGVLAAAMVIASQMVAGALAGGQIVARMSLTHSEAWRPVGAFTGVPWIGSFGPSWGASASLLYFAGVVAVV